MKINAQMQCKAAGFDLDECHIERVVEIPKVDFFRADTLPDGPALRDLGEPGCDGA